MGVFFPTVKANKESIKHRKQINEACKGYKKKVSMRIMIMYEEIKNTFIVASENKILKSINKKIKLIL